MEDKNETCEKCAFFSQHFSYTGNCYHTVNCGHCLKRVKNKDNRGFPNSSVCEQWKPKDEVIVKRKQSIAEALLTMSERIDEILSMINNGYLDI